MADELEKLAVELNEDSKASRRKPKTTAPAEITDLDPLGVGAESGQIMTSDGLQEAPIVADEDEEDDGSTPAMDLACERFIRIAMEADFGSGTLRGDIRDTLLDLFIAQPRPWTTINEVDQSNIVASLDQVAEVIVSKAMTIIQTGGDLGGAVHAILDSYTEKGGLSIKLTAEGDRDSVIALHDAVGGPVILRKVTSKMHQGARRDAAAGVMPDQPGLFEAEVERAAGEYQGNDDDLAGGFDDNEAAVADALASQDED